MKKGYHPTPSISTREKTRHNTLRACLSLASAGWKESRVETRNAGDSPSTGSPKPRKYRYSYTAIVAYMLPISSYYVRDRRLATLPRTRNKTSKYGERLCFREVALFYGHSYHRFKRWGCIGRILSRGEGKDSRF